MANNKMANRQVGTLKILNLADKKPFMDADFCNSTSFGFQGDNTYALKNGQNAIAFADPMTGSIKLEFAVAPFKVFSLMNDQSITTTMVRCFTETITASSTTSLTFTTTAAVAGTIYVYNTTDDCGTPLTVTVSGQTITGTFVSGTSYIVRGMATVSTSVKRIEINNSKLPKDYMIQIETVDKAEDGTLLPKIYTYYKCTPKRNFDCTLASTGDAVNFTMEFDCLVDSAGKVMDISVIGD